MYSTYYRHIRTFIGKNCGLKRLALDFAPPSLHKFSWFCVQRKCYWPHYVDSACPSFFAVQMKWGKIQTNTQVAKERKANFCHLIQLFQRQSAYVAVTINIICVLKMIHYERSTYMSIFILSYMYICMYTYDLLSKQQINNTKHINTRLMYSRVI